MKKLALKTTNLAEENIQKLSSLFPNLITEKENEQGELIKTIDVDKLKELVGDYADESSEVYSLGWVGKSASRRKIAGSINKTLRPAVDESVDFEKTKNVFIEGDNFEVLKLLRESYLNSIKMIYIDPPYNTGKDFVYKDNFTKSREEYDVESKAVDEEGNKLFKNTTTNGRFHSDWLSMMFERLTLARDLLKDDGVIFISIDDNEVANLRKICDEIFGEGNFVGEFIRRTRSGGGFGTSDIGIEHDYIICFAKSRQTFLFNKLKKEDVEMKKYFNKSDEQGPYHLRELRQSDNQSGRREDRPFMFFGFTIKNGKLGIIKEEEYKEIYKNSKFNDEFIKKLNKEYAKIIWPIRGDKSFGRWSCGYEKACLLLQQGNIECIGDKIFNKERINSDREEKVITTLLTESQFTNTNASMELKQVIENGLFDFPKPISLINLLSNISTNPNSNDIVLDFFAGSGTTAHAVMQLNAEDGGNRRFVMVQLPEETDKDSEAYKAGYKTIAEISKERIRRAGKKIQEDNKKSKEPKDLSHVDFGFKVFKVDSSNMKDVYYNPSAIDQRTLSNFKDNIKEDRTPEDLLYQVLLDMAIPLDAKVNIEKIKGKKVFVVKNPADEAWLVACFEEGVDLDLIKEIAELKPLKAVFRDSSFKSDKDKVNTEEYLKNKSPNTQLGVI